ncbi:MAG: methyl-accepting chemotaxis protein [Lachnospiraceae bacterium]|nr:methyl-accepting chemotaxis protein [Lachnospiraceae bacterium]
MATNSKKDSNSRKGGLTASIKAKLIITMMLLTAIPLMLAVVVSFVTTIRNSAESAEEVNEKQLEIISGDINDLINQNMQALVTLSNSPESRVIAESGGKFRNLPRFVRYLQQVDENLNDSNSTVLTNADGDQLARSKGNLTNTADREYFTHAMNGEQYISEVIVSKTTGSRIIVPVVPVYADDETTVLGFVQRNFDLEVLHELLAAEADEDQVIVITDRNGVVIAHSGHEIKAEDPEDNRSATEYFRNGQTTKSTMIGEIDGKKYIISSMSVPTTGWVIINERSYDSAMKTALTGALNLVILGLIALILAVVIAWILARSFANPIATVNESLEKLSQGEFMPIRDAKLKARKDEIGNIVAKTNLVIDKLGEIVNSIKESATSVGSSSEELAETTSQISKTADDVSTAVQEIATGATQQADEIQHATENTGKISDNILDVSNNATGLENTAQNMSGNSKESVEQLEKLRLSSDQMKTAIDDISEKIGATSKAVENINSKVAAITSIASQTNLLALNASIEAARAGDAGKGFAVVAEEIGKLADDSAVSASEIRSEMEVLLSESQAAVDQAQAVRETTEEQSAILAATVESVGKLIEDIQTTVNGVQSINQAAELCTDSKTVVVDAMSSLSAISEENAAASEETSASMQELNATVNTLSFAADRLRDIAGKLNEEIAFFK